MGDAEGRALGAGQYLTVEGRTYHLRPIRLGQLQELQREALDSYRQDYLRAYHKTLDFLQPAEKAGLMRQKIDEAARWTLADLPNRPAHSLAGCAVTDELRALVLARYPEVEGDDDTFRAVAAAMLDSEDATVAEVTEAVGVAPRVQRVRFDSWWITGCVEGMVAMLHHSVSQEHPEVTRDEVRNWPVSAAMVGARAAESLTAPSVGNT